MAWWMVWKICGESYAYICEKGTHNLCRFITSLIIYHFRYFNIYLLPGPNIITTTTSTTTTPPTTTTSISTTEEIPASAVTATLVRTTQDFITAISSGADVTVAVSRKGELQTTSELSLHVRPTTSEQSSSQSKYEKGSE